MKSNLPSLKHQLLYILLTPWLMAFLNENVLPESGSYIIAKVVGLMFYVGTSFYFIACFIEQWEQEK